MNFLSRTLFYCPAVSLTKTIWAAWPGIPPTANTKLTTPCGRAD